MLHKTLLQVFQNAVFENPAELISWEKARDVILAGRVQEVSFDLYMRVFAYRRADNVSLRAHLILARNYLLGMASRGLTLSKSDATAFVLRHVFERGAKA